MCEFKANILSAGTVLGYSGTWVWGYLAEAGGQTTCEGLVDWYYDGEVNGTSGPLETYLGPVILNQRGSPTEVTWVNELPTTAKTYLLAWKYSTDQTLHWADPLNNQENMCNHMAMYLINNTKWGGERINGVDGGMFTFEPRSDFTGVSVGGITTKYSETPQAGDTEIWEMVNITADAHPIHLHLVQFQRISRQAFNFSNYNAAFPGGGWDPMLMAPCALGVYCPGFGPPLPYNGTDPLSGGKLGGNPDVAALSKSGKPLYLQGKPMPPNPNEAGWKDTIIVYPGQETRIAVRWAPTELPVQTTPNLGSLYFPFDPSGGFRMDGDGNVLSAGHGFVWHCHIIDHEDNEMMRPDLVQQNPAFIGPQPPSRTVIKGTHY